MKNHILLILLSLFLLSGCDGATCIDPDDFGFIKYVISARYDQSELSGQQDNEVAPWRNTGYAVNGQPLTIIVQPWNPKKGDLNNAQELSAWCPWFGTSDNTNTLSPICASLQECAFIDNQMCTTDIDAPISNAPCLMKNGIGLYFLIATRNITKGTTTYSDPNATIDSQRFPDGITRHIGQLAADADNSFAQYVLDKRGDLVRAYGSINYQYTADPNDPSNIKSISDLQVAYSQCPLYFKILDKYYDDNAGQYRITIKSGVSDTRPDPLQFLTYLIQTQLFGSGSSNTNLSPTDQSLIDSLLAPSKNDKSRTKGIVQNIYDKLINTAGYRLSVTAFLSLYIMITGFAFITGNINITHTELTVRVFKVTLISILLNSDKSWIFFHNYLFVFFIEGVQQIIQMINEASSTGPGSSSLLGLLMAPQTMAKLFSLLFTDPLGFIYIIMFLIALYFIFMLVFKATIIYLTAMITVGMIIIMGPIFICFMLFNITRSLFENWLRQLISYAIQPIILFTGLAFLSMIIRTEVYSSLGFGVCKHDFPQLAKSLNQIFGTITDELDLSLGDSIFYWWFPNPMKSEGFKKTEANILVPIEHQSPNGMINGQPCANPNNCICAAYQCIEKRYIELPFLQPCNKDANGQCLPDQMNDQHRIDQFFNGNFVQLDGLLLIFVCIYLLSKFNDIAVSIGKFLSSTSGNLTNLQNVGQEAFAPLKAQMDRPLHAAYDKGAETLSGARKEIVHQMDEKAKTWEAEAQQESPDKHSKGAALLSFLAHPSDTMAKAYEGYQIGGLREEAISKNKANTAVLDEVRRNYGINYADVNTKAISEYQEAATKMIEKAAVNTPISKEKQEKLLGENFATLRDSLVGMHFKDKTQTYDKLTDAQRKEIDKLMTSSDGRTLRELASDANYTRDFQNAYVNAHQDMAERGIGWFGKRSSLLRSWQEVSHKVDKKRELRRQKRLNYAEKLYAGYEGLKRTALTKIVGKDVRDAIEGNLTGAEWHDFDYQDPQLRTYSEALQDQQRQLEYQELRTKIDKETINSGEDVLSPEYITKLRMYGMNADADYYESLYKQKMAFDVRTGLSNEENLVLMGDRFMREKATDQQMEDMITNAQKAYEKMIGEDRYIRREERYIAMHESAVNYIEEQNERLKKYTNGRDVTTEEMPELLARYHSEEKTKPEEAIKESEKLQKAFRDMQYSAEVLEKINARKDLISKEIGTHVEEINKHREDAHMQKLDTYRGYNSDAPKFRKLRTIEEHRHNKKQNP